MFSEYCDGSDAGARARVEGPDTGALDRLRAWLRVPDAGVDRAGCLLAKGTAELAWENDAIAARSLAAHEALLASSRQLIEQAQSAGLVDPEADAAALGGLVVATHRGLEALARVGVDVETMNKIADATIDNITLKPVRERA